MRDNFRKVLAVIVLVLLALAAVSALFQWHRNGTIQQQVAETRRALRAQGFKTDLADFNFRTDAETRSREAALTFFGGTVRPETMDTITLLPTVADGSAVVIWKQELLAGQDGPVSWSDLHDALEENRAPLDAACDAALSGPIQFDLDGSRGVATLLPHLAPLKRLAQTLGSCTVEELHDGHDDSAWTNLLALTRLVTAWKVEPAEVSHLVRFGMADTSFDAAWQALQCDHWSEDQLAALQHEWELADFFTNLPEVVAFERASHVALCQQDRQQPAIGGPPLAEILKESVHAPGSAISAIKRSLDAARYRSYGTYDDEKNLLLFYQQRELEIRQAVASPNWLQMRMLPGVTNPPLFLSPYHPRFQAMLNLRAISRRAMDRGPSFLGRASTAEARRRLVVTAIALERFRKKHGAYPQSLAELAPEFLNAAPVDFMDGRPLRYRLAGDGHFLLYAVGWDGVDHGGLAATASHEEMRRVPVGFGFGTAPEGDIVWPSPAGAEAVAAQQKEELDAAQTKADETEDLQAKAQWDHTALHQAALDIVLAAPPVTNLPDIKLGGRFLSEVLRNPQSTGTNPLSLVEMLTLKQVITGGEPETVTFELPITYDAITNLGEALLYIDPTNSDDSDMGCNVMDLDCKRAANGDCLLVWSTLYESPGKHALQAGLSLNDLPPDKQDLDGPLLPFTITNLCQFSLGSQRFEPGVGSALHAKLPEADARYVIELNTTNGDRLTTISGSTSNGEIRVFWNLVDDHGHRFAGDEFNSVFHLTLPDSGRTQTLRGP